MSLDWADMETMLEALVDRCIDIELKMRCNLYCANVSYYKKLGDGKLVKVFYECAGSTMLETLQGLEEEIGLGD